MRPRTSKRPVKKSCFNCGANIKQIRESLLPEVRSESSLAVRKVLKAVKDWLVSKRRLYLAEEECERQKPDDNGTQNPKVNNNTKEFKDTPEVEPNKNVTSLL